MTEYWTGFTAGIGVTVTVILAFSALVLWLPCRNAPVLEEESPAASGEEELRKAVGDAMSQGIGIYRVTREQREVEQRWS